MTKRPVTGREAWGADVGSLIRIRRLAAGLTQRELADLAQVSLGTVRDLEQGRTRHPRVGSVAWRAGVQVGLGEPRQRAVLAVLALSPDVAVHRETLIDALWHENPPARAIQLLQTYVSRLRRALDPGRSEERRVG